MKTDMFKYHNSVFRQITVCGFMLLKQANFNSWIINY